MQIPPPNPSSEPYPLTLTIDQMIEACVKHNSTENTVTQAVAQGIAQGVSGVFAVISAKDKLRCFNCGQFGHFIVECPEKEAVADHQKDHQWLNSNPDRWWKQRNGKQSVGRRSMTTTNALPTSSERRLQPAEDRHEDQFPHGRRTPAREAPSRMKKTNFTPRFRREPGASW